MSDEVHALRAAIRLALGDIFKRVQCWIWKWHGRSNADYLHASLQNWHVQHKLLIQHIKEAWLPGCPDHSEAPVMIA